MGKTIAIIGAGPGVGLSVAQRFGREGFNVALISRDPAKLEVLVNQLKADGIESAAFTADVRNRPTLTAALEKAIAHFGLVDVLEYGPTPAIPGTVVTPSAMDVENEQYHLDLAILGAIAAVQAVLPGMLERKAGALLFTSAASAIHPLAITASFGVAAGAALNYARVLNQELMPKNIYSGIVLIAGLVVQNDRAGGKSPVGLELIAANAIADLHWSLYSKRDRCEAVIGDTDAVLKLAGRTFAEPVVKTPLIDNLG